jgi:hypothetical protein
VIASTKRRSCSDWFVGAHYVGTLARCLYTNTCILARGDLRAILESGEIDGVRHAC